MTESATQGMILRARERIRHLGFRLVAVLFVLVLHLALGAPPPERLLPPETLMMVTAPDFARLKAAWSSSPMYQLWDDPVLRPLRARLVARGESELLQPLARELGLDFDAWPNLFRGQATFALVENAPSAPQATSWVLLLDTVDQGASLRGHLAAFRKHWLDLHKPLRAEKVGNYEFTVIALSTNDMPVTLKPFLPRPLEYQELGVVAPPTPATDLVFGYADALLVVGNSLKTVDQVLAHLSGAPVPALGDLAAYQADYQAVFRGATACAWVNAKALFNLLERRLPTRDNPEAPAAVETVSARKLLAALGLAGVRSLALSYQDSREGGLFQVFVAAPQPERQGLVQLLGGEAKDTSVPPFVPADAVHFRRWRLDSAKACDTLARMLVEISPSALNSLQFVLTTASSRANEKNPGFDLTASLRANLGDDFIKYDQAPSPNAPAETSTAVWLIGSPNPEQLALALKALLVVLPDGDGIADREFLGRKIFSVPLPAESVLPFFESQHSGPPVVLHWAGGGGYLALSTDPGLVEKFLRDTANPPRALRDLPGLADAAQKVVGPGTFFFGYENRAEALRPLFPAPGKETAAAGAAAIPAMPALPGWYAPEKKATDWLDLSLLPAFDKVARYFHFTVYSGSDSVEGLTFRLFLPTPPGLRK